MDQKEKPSSKGIKWINFIILAVILYLFLRPRTTMSILFAVVFLFVVVFSIIFLAMLALAMEKNKQKKKHDAISYTRVYIDDTRKRDINKDKYRKPKREEASKTKHIKEVAPYTYTTSHTEAKIKETRTPPFQGTLYLDNIDIGGAIGLIKLANKLVGVKDITMQLMTGKGAVIMGIEANDAGILKFKVKSPSTAIKILRKACSEYDTTNVTGEIRLRHTKGNEVETLLEIAQDMYKAKI